MQAWISRLYVVRLHFLEPCLVFVEEHKLEWQLLRAVQFLHFFLARVRGEVYQFFRLRVGEDG
jgi:hypothetical protein